MSLFQLARLGNFEYGIDVKRSKLREIREGIGYFLINFATPVVFYITFRKLGSKPAIGFSVFVTFLQVLAHLILRIRFSPFFMIASGFTVLFGTIDLFLQNPRFFRLEPFVQNLIMGTFFWVTYFTHFPIAKYFMDALPEKVRPDLSRIPAFYLRRLTGIWAGYLCVKAIVFLYLAFQVDLGRLIVLRSIIGGGSIFILMILEIPYRKWILKDRSSEN